MTLLPGLVVSSIAVALGYLAVVAGAALVGALRLGGRREEPIDDYDALSSSRFTIPVSVIVPLVADAATASGREGARSINATIASIVGLNYPELEAIVVAEGLPEDVWASIKTEWELAPREFFYRQTLATGAVRMIYRSVREPRLMVVDKVPAGSRADAMNCGVNLARFRYVTSVSDGIVFDAGALLRAMDAPLRDPAAVAGATSHVEIAPRSGASEAGSGQTASMERLESIRSLMASRLTRRAPVSALVPKDAVVVWRRDAVVQLGGFSTSAADAELDLAVRVETAAKISGRVVRTAEIFGHVGSRPAAERMHLAARRQRATLQATLALWRSGATGRRSVAYLLAADVLTPLAQAWAVGAAAVSAAAGWIPWADVLLVVLLLSLGRAILSGAALLLRGSTSGAPDGSSLKRLIFAAPFEFVTAAPAAFVARIAGLRPHSKLE